MAKEHDQHVSQYFLNDLSENLVNAHEHIINRAKQQFQVVIINELNDLILKDHEHNEPSLNEISDSFV
jgi:hypothetical protein